VVGSHVNTHAGMMSTGILKEAWDKAYDKWVVHNDWTAKQVEEKDYNDEDDDHAKEKGSKKKENNCPRAQNQERLWVMGCCIGWF
jgi:hypothetical protein